MKRKGSITVFLSLVLVLLFSFILNMLEGARIAGASAYASMLSELAGDSFLASYYYPLFEEYRLFGVHAGDEAGFFSEEKIQKRLEENLSYGFEGLDGGLLQFEKPEIEISGYQTLLSNSGAVFLSQVREQALLDGASLALTELFSENSFAEAAIVGEVYQKQEETLQATSNVTKELLKLMELVDGVCTNDRGLQFTLGGRIKTKDTFIKQLLPMEPEMLKNAYGNNEVYSAVKDSFFKTNETAWEVISLLEDIAEQQQKLAEAEELVKQSEYLYGATSEMRKEVVQARDALAEELASTQRSAQSKYNKLKKTVRSVESLTEDALKVLEQLEKKQIEARVVIEAYEGYLSGVLPSLSGELGQVFEEELEEMKAYVGMEENGYYVPTMRASLESNRELLQGIVLEGFSDREADRVRQEMELVMQQLAGYTVDGLWFTYGNIVVSKHAGKNVTGVLADILTSGVLALAGISEKELSDRALTGQDLPSAGLEKTNLLDDLLACIDTVSQLFGGENAGEILQEAADTALGAVALELYCTKYFHCYTGVSPYTKLQYEREYLLFGAEEDETNLLYTVLYLVAVRTMFCMVAILKDSGKMAQLEAFAAGIAGLTGIPALLAIIKYALLILWAVEEAFVETAALLQGKKVAVVSSGGIISFAELFTFNTSMVNSKAAGVPDYPGGASYENYLTLFSLTIGIAEKVYRAMDLIQENIRYRYNDSFRMRNVVTQLTFCTDAELKKKYNTGLLPDRVYQWRLKESCSY